MENNNDEIIGDLNRSFEIELPAKMTLEELKEKLSIYFNRLIESDFQKLMSLLYRIDISEIKLRTLLEEHPGTDAGRIIAGLVIERQLQKVKSRSQFSKPDSNIDDEDRW